MFFGMGSKMGAKWHVPSPFHSVMVFMIFSMGIVDLQNGMRSLHNGHVDLQNGMRILHNGHCGFTEWYEDFAQWACGF